MDTYRKAKIAYLGPASSYSQQAALQYFSEGRNIFVPQASIKEVFDTVQSSACERGVVPFENSTHGSVVFTLDLLTDREARYAELRISGETCLPIHHCLSIHTGNNAIKERRNGTSSADEVQRIGVESNDAKLKKIRDVYSHPQAFGQCGIFLDKYLKHAQLHEVSSTSRAAEIVAADQSGASAAISSSLAAEVLGLEIVAREIEDRHDNTTRFLVLEKSSCPQSPPAAIINTDHLGLSPTRWKSLITFKVDHYSPGALADALGVFQPHRLNLTSINSRPSHEFPWHYVFLIEVRAEDPGDGKLEDALRGLEKYVTASKFWGTWVEERHQRD